MSQRVATSVRVKFGLVMSAGVHTPVVMHPGALA